MTQQQYVLYNRLGSGGFLVEAMLSVAGLPFKYEPLKSLPNTPVKPLIEHVNPWGQVPVLVTPDGQTTLTECGAILIYLVEHEPKCRNGPHLFDVVNDNDNSNDNSKSNATASASAALLRWTVFLSVNVYEGILRENYPRRYFEPFDGDDDLNAKIAERVKRSARKRTHDAFLLLEEHVISQSEDGFLLGEKLSPVDIYLAFLYAWHNKQPDLPKCTNITKKVATHELIRPIWERNFHNRLDEKWHLM